MMFERALRAALADLRLNLLSVFSVAVAFVCLSATLWVAFNIQAVQRRYEQTGHASVYLRARVEMETVAEVERALRQAPGVLDVKYVSAEEARREILQASGDEALGRLPHDAFPASLEVSLEHPDAVERVKALKTQLEQLPAVESVEVYQSFRDRLKRLLTGGVTAALVLTLVVLAAVTSVVGSTMRMALTRRSVEVEVLKMVGATDDYVRGPFVIEGALQGGLGALGAVLLLGLLHLIVRDAMQDTLGSLLGTQPVFLPFLAIVGLLVLGASLGALSARLNLRRLVGTFG